MLTPGDVVTYAPEAAPVTQGTCDEAADWVQGEVERAQATYPAFTVPVSTDRRGRELQRATCAYALYLQARNRASTSRVTNAGGGAVKKITVGPIEVDQAVVDPESAAAGMAVSAGEWLAAVWRHLVAAGIPRPRLVAGVSL